MNSKLRNCRVAEKKSGLFGSLDGKANSKLNDSIVQAYRSSHTGTENSKMNSKLHNSIVREDRSSLGGIVNGKISRSLEKPRLAARAAACIVGPTSDCKSAWKVADVADRMARQTDLCTRPVARSSVDGVSCRWR